MRLRRILAGGLPKEHQHEFELVSYMSHRVSMRLMGVFITLLELYMLITVLVMPGPVNASPNRFIFFLCYFSLLAVTLIFVIVHLVADKYLQKNPSMSTMIYFFYSLFICLWSAFITGYSHRNVADISVFLYIALSVAALMPMKPYIAAVVFTSDWIVFYIVMKKYIATGVDPFSSLLNSAFAALICIGVSSILYRNRVSGFLSNKTILLQNKQIQEMNERLSAIVLIDDLTKIHNRRYLEKELPGVLEQARERMLPVATYMIDIDSFKDYNRLYGHQEGDVCMRRVADTIGEVCTKRNAHLMRYGGEEFLVFATDIDSDEAVALGQAIRVGIEKLAIPHAILPSGVLTVSVGAYSSRGDGSASLNQMIHYADIAMYVAKARGKNQVEYYNATTEIIG